MTCRNISSWGLALVLMVAVVAARAQAAEERPEPEMSPEQQAMMAAWQHAMTPGEPHAGLAALAGDWEFSGTFWLEPGAPPMTSTGTVERSMLLDGRVLQERVTSTFMGSPFEGLGLTGYDNVSGDYWAIWTDNMGTGVMVATGSCEGESCTFHGRYNDPMTGGPKSVRMTVEHSEGREVMRSFEAGPDGTEQKTMELIYTRPRS